MPQGSGQYIRTNYRKATSLRIPMYPSGRIGGSGLGIKSAMIATGAIFMGGSGSLFVCKNEAGPSNGIVVWTYSPNAISASIADY
jgi:hypothetical protein